MRFRVWYGNGRVSTATDKATAEFYLKLAQRYRSRARLSRSEGGGRWSVLTKRGWRLLG